VKPSSESETAGLEPVTFYPGKKQLLPIAFNIAVAPMLLYLLGLWAWPPSLVHLVAFVFTSLIAIRFVRSHQAQPALMFDQEGIRLKRQFYPVEQIKAVKPYMRTLKIQLEIDGKTSEKVVNLWWAGGDIIESIYREATTRYPLIK
jgi:hypothetical protein